MSSNSSKDQRNSLGVPPSEGSKTFVWADFSFPSTLKLAPMISLLLEPVKCQQTLSRLQLGLQEALVNAVKHGNNLDARKCVRVRRILTPNWFVWQIQDEGRGMNPSNRIALLPLQLDSNGGRGLFLINQSFDDVRWSQRGNRLQLASRRVKAISGEDIQGP